MTSLPISVSGGTDGIAAHLDDLRELAALLHGAGQFAWEAGLDLVSPVLEWAVMAGTAADAVAAADAMSGLDSLRARLAQVREDLDGTALLVTIAMTSYDETDHGVLSDIGRFLSAVGGAGSLLSSGGGIPGKLIDPAFLVPRVVAPFIPDGSPELHDLGIDTATTVAPRSLTDLITGLSRRNEGRPGEISVSFVAGADGRRRAIVDIPGTKSWSPFPVRDVTNLGTDIISIAGSATSYERGIFAAMAAAGVTPTTPVLLVGHSEGGIVAVDAAHHAAESGRFTITHVVTAGAPVGEIARQLPSHVSLLALENRVDNIPDLDGALNPDRRNVTTVRATIDRGSPGGNHSLDETYTPEAAAADASRNRSITDFLGSARGFLDGDAMTTHAYVITRGS
ncbi:MAG: hypothetical protein ACRDVG_11645 [Jatrophihabitantaceae bacterium]